MVQVTFRGNPITLVGDQVNVGEKAPNFTLLSNDLQEKTLDDYKGQTLLISVVPSLDTEICSVQTKKFNDEASVLQGVKILTVSMDLPFAQARWCGLESVNNIETLSDHREASFGENYGVLIKELRLLTRSLFVVDQDQHISYVEYVDEVGTHPNYDAVLEHLRNNK